MFCSILNVLTFSLAANKADFLQIIQHTFNQKVGVWAVSFLLPSVSNHLLDLQNIILVLSFILF